MGLIKFGNDRIAKIIIAVLAFVIFLYLIYRITYDFSYIHTIENYLDSIGK